MKSISFIIPTIWKSHYLDDLLFFLLGTGLGEVVLVDNSGNGALDKDLLEKYSGLKYIYSEQQGLSLARNVGGFNANSDYLYFLDDDVIPLNNGIWIRSVKEMLASKEQLKCIGGNILLPSDADTGTKVPMKYNYIFGEKYFGDFDRVLENDYFGPTNLIIQKDIFIECGGFDQSYGHFGDIRGYNEDVFLQERIRKKGYSFLFKQGIDLIHEGYVKLNKKEVKIRLSLQGEYDFYLDQKLNLSRLILRSLKYMVVLSYFNIVRLFHLSSYEYFDEYRYESYILTLRRSLKKRINFL